MEEMAFEEFLRELVDSEPEERILKIRETWPELNKEQQETLEELLERIREPEEEVRRGESATEADERRTSRTETEEREEKPEEAIYTREETTTEEAPKEEERRPYRAPDMGEEGAFTPTSDEERESVGTKEEEYVRRGRFRKEADQASRLDISEGLAPAGAVEQTDVTKRLKKKYIQE